MEVDDVRVGRNGYFSQDSGETRMEGMEVYGQVFRRVEPVLGIFVCHTTRQHQTSILVMACSYWVPKLYKLELLEYAW